MARSPAARYGVALLVLGLAVAIRLTLDPVLGPSQPFVTYIATAAVVAWLGGLGPALLVLGLGFVAGDYLFVHPRGALGSLRTPAETLRALGSLGVGAFVAALVCRMRAVQRRAESAAAEAGARARELEVSERRLRRLVESDMIGILFWDEAGTITKVNDALLAMAGRRREDVEGRVHWRGLVAAPMIPRHERALAEVLATGSCAPIESELVRPDGGRLPILCAAARIDDQPLQGVTWVLDIAARKQGEAEREGLLAIAERARSEAEQASRAKDQFLAMLGHELRNPLSAVHSAVRVARADPSRRDRALEIIERQSAQLGRLIDDLLDVARVTSGRITLRRTRLALAEVVEGAVEAARGSIDDGGHELVLAPPAEPVHVDADPARIEQALVNLLTNAAKYTPRGGRIEVAAGRREAEAFVRVRDSGHGIAPQMLPHVFDLFIQGERTLDRAQGGLGVGLTVVRRLVELHGGRVTAHSAGVGTGAEFEIVLPLAAAVSEREDGGGGDGTRARARRAADIVLIEDSSEVAEALATLLEVLGHRVRRYHDGVAGLAAAAAEPPELMLVDIGLPGIDGYEVARRARRERALAATVLVALTGYGGAEARARALAAGFDHHLVKPVDTHALEDVIAAVGAS